MTSYILVLKGTNKDESIFEFENLWRLYFKEEIKIKQLKNTYFYFNSELDINCSEWFERLTFTNEIFKVLFESSSFDELYKIFEDFSLKEFEGKSFRARIKRIGFSSEKFSYDDYLKPFWKKIENPRVDLENPDNELLFFHYNGINNSLGKDIKFANRIFLNKKEYLKRMPKLRPIKKPYTLKSDMARVAINYLNIKEGIILDPFCGIGGILLEAWDMGFSIIGNDINYKDLKSLIKNFKFYYPMRELDLNDDYIRKNLEGGKLEISDKFSLFCKDARIKFLENNSIDGLVTDIPYGKSSRLLGRDLYDDFLKLAKDYLKPNSRLVIIYANFTPFKDIALKYFKEVIEIEEYINKSMTRYILVLEKRE